MNQENFTTDTDKWSSNRLGRRQIKVSLVLEEQARWDKITNGYQTGHSIQIRFIVVNRGEVLIFLSFPLRGLG